MPSRLLLLPAIALLQGCAAKPVSLFDRPPPPRPVAIVPLYEGGDETFTASAADTRKAVADARRKVETARKGTRADPDRERLLPQAEQAARQGNNPRAQSLARQAGNRADAALQAQRTREAAALLKVLYDTTGLSDAQLAGLRAAEAQLVRGENLAALTQLRSIQTVAQKPRGYTVQRGDTLSAIAAREGVYGNSLLWPLLWAANREAIPDPHRLRAGQTLKIRPSPTVDEVVQAIQTARQHPARVKIGRVKTLPK